MSKLKDPLGVLSGLGSETVRKVSVLSRFENTQLGVCPVCGNIMQVLQVDQVPAYVCLQDCICVPTPNEK